MQRIIWTLLSTLGLWSGGTAEIANAQTYPNAPIRAVVGYDAGGPLDVVARVVAQDMARSLGQSVIVDNKPGASGLIATEQVARAKPDGYTLLFVPSTFVVNPLLMERVAYRPLTDFAFISRISTSANVLVASADAKLGSMSDLVALAKSAPNKVSFASSGIGGPAHLSGELLAADIGVPMIHVPFKGSAPALSEVLSGRVTFMFYPLAGLSAHLASGRLKALAVAGTPSRLAELPGVPTMSEAGLAGFADASLWFGLVAPARTPQPVVARLNAALRQALSQPATIERLKSLGAQSAASTPEEFAAFVRDDAARWDRIIDRAHIRLSRP